MTMTNAGEPQSASHDASAFARAAADDMASIFGPGRRGAVIPEVASAGWFSMPRKTTVLAAAALLVGSIGAGVLVGESLKAVTVNALAPGVGQHSAQSNRRILPVQPMAPPPQFAAMVLNTKPLPSLSPLPLRADPPHAVPSSTDAPAMIQDAKAIVPARQIRAAPMTSVVQPPSSMDGEVATPAPTLARSKGCDEDDGACLASRVQLAEDRLEDAYQQAATAGVRGRLLRGYEREWGRARDEASNRPLEAIRLYAMITSDLRNLAEDQATREYASQQ